MTLEKFISKQLEKLIEETSSQSNIAKFRAKHQNKLHFVPLEYRVLGGLLHSLNIKFGNFLEQLITALVENDGNYKIITEICENRSNKFKISANVDALIDSYITRCQSEHVDCIVELPRLLQKICTSDEVATIETEHDVDILFLQKTTGIYFYIELKYNDDHDSGKFVDINRKLLKTYAYLSKKLNITNQDRLVPILYYFNEQRRIGNIYLPEDVNVYRGRQFFERFLSVEYNDVAKILETLAQYPETLKLFHKFNRKVTNI